MQRLIAWLLQRYTPFRVLAWGPDGKIAGIGYSNVTNVLAGSGVAQMRAQQFEAAMKEGNSESLGRGTARSFAAWKGEPVEHSKPVDVEQRKPWPLDRRSTKR